VSRVSATSTGTTQLLSCQVSLVARTPQLPACLHPVHAPGSPPQCIQLHGAQHMHAIVLQLATASPNRRTNRHKTGVNTGASHITHATQGGVWWPLGLASSRRPTPPLTLVLVWAWGDTAPADAGTSGLGQNPLNWKQQAAGCSERHACLADRAPVPSLTWINHVSVTTMMG